MDHQNEKGYKEADLVVFQAVLEHFNQDLREFWARSNFYLLIQSGLLSVFAVLTSSENYRGSDQAVLTALGMLGLTVAIIWFVVMKGCIFWIRKWRTEVIRIDEVVDRHMIFSRVENYASSNPFMSPSNVTQYLPLVFIVVWIVMLLSLAL